MLERDSELLRRLEAFARMPFEGTVFRVVWANNSPIQGSSSAHGRWNSPSGGFEVLNTSLTSECSAAEFEAFWSLFEQRPDRLALNWAVKVRLDHVVELDFEQLEELGVRRSEYGRRNYSRTQEVSYGLNYLRCDGLIVPSARYEGRNLVVYVQNLGRGCFVKGEGESVFSWSDARG